MKAKSIFTVGLLAFVGVSVAYLVVEETSQPVATVPAQAEPVTGEAKQQLEHKVIAYYFHRTQRCKTCLKIEANAEAAMREAFPEAFESGKLEWRTANLEEPANEHFVTAFELTASGIILVDMLSGKQGKWTELYKVWELVDKEDEFGAYVKAETGAFLGQGS